MEEVRSVRLFLQKDDLLIVDPALGGRGVKVSIDGTPLLRVDERLGDRHQF